MEKRSVAVDVLEVSLKGIRLKPPLFCASHIILLFLYIVNYLFLLLASFVVQLASFDYLMLKHCFMLDIKNINRTKGSDRCP